VLASTVVQRLWTYVLMSSIAVQSASTLTLRSAASPLPRVAAAAFAAAAAWIKARRAAMLTGSDENSAIAATIVVCIRLARERTPGTLARTTPPNEGLGLVGVDMVVTPSGHRPRPGSGQRVFAAGASCGLIHH
jgi:hypothetical protein